MKRETFELAKKSLQKFSIEGLFELATGKFAEDMEGHEATNEYPLMMNVENGDLFFLEYAVNHNGLNMIAEQQNPWVTLGWVSARDINMGDPAGDIESKLSYMVDYREQYERED